MHVYEKVLNIIVGGQANGHAVANQLNKLSLAKAKSEIETLLKGKL